MIGEAALSSNSVMGRKIKQGKDEDVRMVKHIVMWKLKDPAEGAPKKQNAEKIKAALESLKTRIPQIRHIEVGINFIESDAAYDVALFAEFNSEKDLETYQKHPDHVMVADFAGKVRENRAVVDYKL